MIWGSERANSVGESEILSAAASLTERAMFLTATAKQILISHMHVLRSPASVLIGAVAAYKWLSCISIRKQVRTAKLQSIELLSWTSTFAIYCFASNAGWHL